MCTNTRNLRRTLILFGGAAGITHGILDRKNKDVGILVGVEVLAILYDMIDNRWGEGLLQGLTESLNGTNATLTTISEVTVELDQLSMLRLRSML